MIVGDLHGCLDELLDLLEEVAFDPRADHLVSVGDLVGKGPDGAGVVRFLRMGGHCAVRGNHDDKVLRWRKARVRGRAPKPLPMSHELHAEAMGPEDWAWLEALPFHLPLPEHGALVVHAGLRPDVSVEAQEPKHLMNLRSLRDDGSASSRIDDGVPWASRYEGPPHVYFGHDAIRGLQRWYWATGLDTGCVYGGDLTAVVLPERALVSVRARKAYAPTR